MNISAHGKYPVHRVFAIILTDGKSQCYNKAIPKNLYTIPKHTISASQTVRFSLRNGPFCVLKRAVLERKMACVSNLLIINVVQRRPNRRNNMNYFNNLLPVFSCCFLTLLNNLDTKKGMVIAIPFYFNALLRNLINSFVVSRTLLTF